ncbi:MAG: exonuclease SbcCD subunit D C-terminal domain-containing protein [Deltaproteobacteria bacterium]|nr:exonuclease SbcCD subunit D C-terminal domain-containing protein [Deltaproteobacteria bacterium]MBW2663445.1 exonuclease SbcCD subunit D C-terminal domain-containing protein [Deltaproteobacteria bacterium]
MKILHTSDWHIGRSLYGRKRYNEFSAFLDWLAEFIQAESIDALLVAGDVFDNSTPSNHAQELYYRFLCKVSASCCRHIVVIAGNHDSPSFLNAPKELLRALNVHVVGSITDNSEDEVITLIGNSGIPEAIVCAVPYLRDRDIRIVEAGESIEDKNTKLIDGLQEHYAEVFEIAEEKQRQYGNIPIIGMGHLFTAGGKTVEGDGVRELYVGSLAHVGEEVFPACIDYLALGHLHVPQKVGATEYIRYSGSPIPMGYGETFQEKSVVIVEFSNDPQITQTNADERQKENNQGESVKSEDKSSFKNPPPKITIHPVPCFQALERISGGIDEITERIHELKSQTSNAWLEIEYTGTEIAGNLRELIDEAVSDTEMEIRRIKNKRLLERVISQTSENETLDDLDVNDVFIRCLNSYEVLENEHPALIQSYKETLQGIQEEDLDEE